MRPTASSESKLFRLARATLPNMLLLILIPVGVLALTRARAVLWFVWPLFIVLYVPFAFLLYHYCIVPTPSIVFAVLLGVVAIEQAWPRFRDSITVFVTAVIVILAVAALPEFDRLANDDDFDTPVTAFDRRLATLVSPPAIVLYKFGEGDVPDDEPVYNDDVMWPDDAPIIRAHDLSGEQNRRLFEYYAEKQPDRRVYRVERRAIRENGYRPEYLGTAKELADRYNPPRP
jgi:hypothetical protein